MSRQADLSPLPQLHHNQSASLHNLTVQEMGKNFFLFGAPQLFFSFFRSLFLSIAFSQTFVEQLAAWLLSFTILFYISLYFIRLLSFFLFALVHGPLIKFSKNNVYVQSCFNCQHQVFYFVILLLY